MKKALCVMMAMVFSLTFAGCGQDKVVNGRMCETVGVINILVNDNSIMEQKQPNVQYKIIWGNVIWGAVLFGTVIAPIYFYGFSMFEPVGPLAVGEK